MKYTVTCSCGHKIEVVLFGKTSDREAKLKWYETQALCPDCYNAQIKESSREYGLPTLEGTEKQVAWAEKIRIDMMEQVPLTRKILEGEASAEETVKFITDNIEKAKEHQRPLLDKIIKILTETNATWFIDHR